ncbi:McrC family protein [Fodinibius sp. SL11]|uniref:McrC family protein n=1 Tax=Fodinibius sp. SL11 TaxID=3425690 RepID=UPI003F884B65
MTNLFEYQNKEELPWAFDGLEAFLDDIWQRREKTGYYYGNDEEDTEEAQRFLQFLHKTGEIKSNKYVGVIHFEGKKINLLPKIFYDDTRKYVEQDISAMQQHVLWWLSYCSKIKFPNYRTSLDSSKNDFFEVLIYLFAKYTRQLLSHSLYQQYEEVRREVNFVRGRLDIDKYISKNLSRARWHKLNCVFDPYVLDNRFNQIIKYVATLLFNQTTNDESKKYLREILFKLDEVSDVKATAKDCRAIKFNPAFSEFETVRDYCQLFLEHAVSFDYKNDLKLFAFLIPMESLFEDFIYGFINKKVDDLDARPQSTAKSLDQDEIFALKPDLILQRGEKRVIADTKYKIVYSNSNNSQKGISQSDLYQVLAYAIRFEINEVALLYPDTLSNYQDEPARFLIRDEFAEDVDVQVKAYQLPVINKSLFNKGESASYKFATLFEDTERKLKERINTII